jgi:7-cyano-7-deazaguanine synthase in queuosine biosynthesis
MSLRSRNALVVWSGGLDSTLALYNAAKYNETYRKVRAVSFVADLLDEEKLKQEKKYREAFKTAFKDLMSVEYYELELKLNGLWGTPSGCPQAAAWLGMISPFIEEDTDVIMGYIKEDSMWYYYTQLQDIFKLYCYINGYERSNLIYPLQTTSKGEIIREAKRNGFYQHTWWCERPNTNERVQEMIKNENFARFHHQYFESTDERKLFMCGTCDPCRTHLLPLIQEKALDDFHTASGEVAAKIEAVEQELSQPLRIPFSEQQFLEKQEVIWTPKRIDTRPDPKEPFEIKTLLQGRFPTEEEMCNCFDPKSKINSCIVHELLDIGVAGCVAVMVEKEGHFPKQMWQRKREDHPPLIKKVTEIHDSIIFDAQLSKRDAAKLRKSTELKPTMSWATDDKPFGIDFNKQDEVKVENNNSGSKG